MNRHSRIFLSPPHMSGREEAYIKEAFASNWIAPLGPHVTAFEKEVAAYAGVRAALAVSSGTAAIHLALRLLGVGQGDMVFCSSLTLLEVLILFSIWMLYRFSLMLRRIAGTCRR